jgi:uncharacterized protein involved in exopolysaccharide biosynthesis
VRSAQFTFRDVFQLFRRRRKLLFLPAVIVTILSGVGAYLLPNKYESSTTILVQRDEILNPLISYEMAVTMASEDRLRTFNEIIYSRTTIRRLMDSLGLSVDLKTEDQRQGLVNALSHNITTERRGSDSFRITYVDTDPVRAQKAASFLSNLFIMTVVTVEGQRNDRAVEFFERKLDELRDKFEHSQKQMVSLLGQRLSTMPTEAKAAYTQYDGVEKQIRDFDSKMQSYKQELNILKTFPGALRTDEGKQQLYDLSRVDIPFAPDLKTLLTKYDELLRRYTPQYPEVEKMEKQVTLLIERMRNAVETEIRRQQPERTELEQRRASLLNEIKATSISERVDEDKESDYGIYRKLYDEMKVKLEQAKTSRDLGSKGASQFNIIDPPLVATQPSKPNRIQLIIAGFGLGLFIGILTAIIRELLDTTVRSARDIEVYQKPVIAFITDGREERLN